VPQRAAVGQLGQCQFSRGLFDSSLSHQFVPMMPRVFTGPRVQVDS
jgi:hypothetical protein